MGMDISVMAVKHRLHVKEPLRLFQEMSDLNHVNLEIQYGFNRDKVMTIIKPETSSYATLELPMCDYLTNLYEQTKSFDSVDWNSDKLKDALVEAIATKDQKYLFTMGENEVFIFLQNLDLWFPDSSTLIRYHALIDIFVANEDSIPEIVMNRFFAFREKMREECERYGCEYAIYYPDSYLPGSSLVSHYNDDEKELIDYINNQSYINSESLLIKFYTDEERREQDVLVHISRFLLEKQKRYPSGKVVNVFIDDFKDLR